MTYNKAIIVICSQNKRSHVKDTVVTVTEWYRTKRPMQLRPFSDLLCVTN
jgi:hypothetical protein